MRRALVLVGTQAALGAALTAPAALFLHGLAVWVPLVGSTIAAFGLIRVWAASELAVDRATVRRLAAFSGAAHAVAGTVAYTALYALMPDAFDFPPRALLVLAPAMGLIPGGLGLALTLVAGDAAVHSSGGWRHP